MFFTNIGKIIDSIFDLVENAGASNLMNQLTVLFSISITITIMIKGYQFLAGKSQEPVKDLIWDISLKMIIITFALNIGGWLDLVTNAMEGINQWAGGGQSLYAEMDKLFAKTRDLANIIKDKGSWGGGAVGRIIVYIGFAIGALPALIIIITTSFTLKVLIMIAPFMIFALFYGWLKNMFTQWLSLFFANTLTVLIVTLIFNAVIKKFNYFIGFSSNLVKNDSLDVIFVAMQVVILGILLSVLIGIARSIAKEIATVSIEGVMASQMGQSLKNSGRGAISASRVTAKGLSAASTVAAPHVKAAAMAGAKVAKQFLSKGK